MARKRPTVDLKSRPKARKGDLESLFASIDADSAESNAGLQLLNIKTEAIERDPTQPRQFFDDASLQDLSLSIQQNGLIQPIEVIQIGQNQYRIVHGERRWRASQLAGLETIPCIVRRHDYDDVTRFVRQLVENIQREELNDVDRARGMARLRDLMQSELNAEAESQGKTPWQTKASWAKVAERLGYSRQRVSQLKVLLDLPPEIQDAVRDGTISGRESRIFQGLTLDQQSELFSLWQTAGLSSEQLKLLATHLKANPQATPAALYATIDDLAADRAGGSDVDINSHSTTQARIEKSLTSLDTHLKKLEKIDPTTLKSYEDRLKQIEVRIRQLQV